jgi:putative permease
MRRVAGYTALALLTLAALFILWQFRAVIALFLFSLALAAAVRPAVTRLAQRRVPLLVALVITYVTGLVILVVLLQIIFTSLIQEIPQMANNLAVTYELLQPQWLEGSTFQRAVAGQLPPPRQVYAAITGERGEMLFQTVFGITRSVILLLAGFASVLLLSVYWSADQVHFERLWLSLLPPNRRAQAREISRQIEANLGSYLRSEIIQSILAGVLLGIGYSWIGLNYPVTLALLGALAWFVPIVGAFLAIIPVVLVGLMNSPLLSLTAAVYTLLVLLVLEFLIEPRLFDRRRHNPLLTVLLMIPLADAYGIPGLMLAPVLAASSQITLASLLNVNGHREARPAKEPTLRIDELRQRLVAIQTMLASPYYPRTPEVTNFIERLSTLISKAGQTLPAETREPASKEDIESAT